jgi:hypothetical protein
VLLNSPYQIDLKQLPNTAIITKDFILSKAIQHDKDNWIRHLQTLKASLTNPSSLLKLLVLALSLLLFQAFLTLPDDLHRKPPAFLFDWLATNKNARFFLLVSVSSYIFVVWALVYSLWRRIFSSSNLQKNSRPLAIVLYEGLEPAIQRMRIFMTDPDLINNKFDLAVWITVYYIVKVMKCFHKEALELLKKTVASVNEDFL